MTLRNTLKDVLATLEEEIVRVSQPFSFSTSRYTSDQVKRRAEYETAYLAFLESEKSKVMACIEIMGEVHPPVLDTDLSHR